MPFISLGSSAISGIFILIGISAFIAFLVTLFTSFGKNSHDLFSLIKIPKPNTNQFLDIISASSGTTVLTVPKTDITHIITEGYEYKEFLIRDISNAEHSIEISSFLWQSDESTDEISKALIDAVKRGVRVRVILDWVGAFGTLYSQKRYLRINGVTLHYFRPFKPGKFLTFYARSHRRAIIIDDTYAYTGGMSFKNEWLKRNNKSYNFVDIMLRVKGKLAKSVHTAFSIQWISHTGEVLTQIKNEDDSNILEKEVDTLKAIHLISSPTHDIHPVSYFFGVGMFAARQSITIASPYFIPGDVITKILTEKALSGINVTLYLQGKTERRFVKSASQSYYNELLNAGVRIFEYQENVLHAKVMVIDNVWTTVGSANIDIRSRRINEENVFGIQDMHFAERIFAHLYSYRARSKEILLSEWVQRSKFKIANDFFLRLFSEQF